MKLEHPPTNKTEILICVLRAETEPTKGLMDLGDGYLQVVGKTQCGQYFSVGRVDKSIAYQDMEQFWKAVEMIKFRSTFRPQFVT